MIELVNMYRIGMSMLIRRCLFLTEYSEHEESYDYLKWNCSNHKNFPANLMASAKEKESEHKLVNSVCACVYEFICAFI